MPRSFHYCLLALLLPCFSLGQERAIEGTKAPAKKTFILGAHLATNGWGATFDCGWRSSDRYQQKVGLTVSNIRHEKERRVVGTLGNAKGYYLGKLVSLVSFRPHYGGQRLLFEAKRSNGIEIAAVWGAGLSIGWVKPVYLQVSDNGSVVEERYTPEVHNTSNIISRASWFRGMGESSVRLGAMGKLGVDLNFSTLKKTISGVVLGTQLDYFPGEDIRLMHNNRNATLYAAFYLQLHLGKKRY